MALYLTENHFCTSNKHEIEKFLSNPETYLSSHRALSSHPRYIRIQTTLGNSPHTLYEKWVHASLSRRKPSARLSFQKVVSKSYDEDLWLCDLILENGS